MRGQLGWGTDGSWRLARTVEFERRVAFPADPPGQTLGGRLGSAPSLGCLTPKNPPFCGRNGSQPGVAAVVLNGRFWRLTRAANERDRLQDCRLTLNPQHHRIDRLGEKSWKEVPDHFESRRPFHSTVVGKWKQHSEYRFFCGVSVCYSNRCHPHPMRIAIVIAHNTANPYAINGNASGQMHMAERATMVSVASVRPPRK